jgi:hypothetical protein
MKRRKKGCMVKLLSLRPRERLGRKRAMMVKYEESVVDGCRCFLIGDGMVDPVE